jgi:hypothetical protein
MFTKTLLPDTLRAIQLVSEFKEIREAYLAGGTALALQIGHRVSVDLDFFTKKEFSEAGLVLKLKKLPSFTEDRTAKWTILGKVGETKFSMFYYEYPLVDKTKIFENISLASLSDIAAMKVHAIEDRGTKRDFIDVYFLSKKYTLSKMLDFYQKKYSVSADRLYFTVRALDYFEDAEKESEMPNMLLPVNWEEVKEFFRKETKRLASEKLGI